MLDALADELDVSDEHRAGGIEPLLVGDAHDAQPIVAAAFSDSDAAADARAKDLPAAARDRIEPRLVEPADDLPHVQVEKPLELDELRRRKRVHVHRRKVRLDVPKQVL